MESNANLMSALFNIIGVKKNDNNDSSSSSNEIEDISSSDDNVDLDNGESSSSSTSSTPYASPSKKVNWSFDETTSGLYEKGEKGRSMKTKEKEVFYGNVYSKLIEITSPLSSPTLSSKKINSENAINSSTIIGNRLRRKRSRKTRRLPQKQTSTITIKDNKTLSILNKRYSFSFGRVRINDLRIDSILDPKKTIKSKNDYYDIENRQREILSDNSMRRTSSGVQMKDPSDFSMLCSLDCFELFDKKWIALVLSDNMFEKVFLHLKSLKTSSLYGLNDDYLSDIYFLECFGMRIEVIENDNQIRESSNFLDDNSTLFDKDSKTIINKINSGPVARFRAFFQNKTHKKVQDSLGIGGNDNDDKKSSSDSSSSSSYSNSSSESVISGRKVNHFIDDSYDGLSHTDVLLIKNENELDIISGNKKIIYNNKNDERKSNQMRDEHINNQFMIDRFHATSDQQELDFGVDDQGRQIRGFEGKTMMKTKVENRYNSIIHDENKWNNLCSDLNSLSKTTSNGFSKMRNININDITNMLGVDKTDEIDKKNDSSSSDEEDIISDLMLRDMMNQKAKNRSFYSSSSSSSSFDTKPKSKEDLINIYNSNIKSAMDSLKTLSRECSLNVKMNNPDSSTTSASEIFSWMEENICVDIFVTPGNLNISNENRKLDFTISLCGLDQSSSINDTLKQ